MKIASILIPLLAILRVLLYRVSEPYVESTNQPLEREMTMSDDTEVKLDWESFRKAFEELGGSVADRPETRGPRRSYKILDARVNSQGGDLVITLTFNQERFPRNSWVTHVLRFPEKVARLNKGLDTKKLEGVVLRIEEVEAEETDPHTLGGKFRVKIGDHLMRFQ